MTLARGLPPCQRDAVPTQHVRPRRRAAVLLALSALVATPSVADARSVRLPAARVLPAPPDVAAPGRGVRRTPSGLAYRVLQRGAGARPTRTQSVKVHYTGWLTSGKMFDSSVVRGSPATFPLTAVIPGWTEILMLMRKGDRVRVWIPEALAYQGAAGKPAGTLVFDIHLLDVL